MKKRELLVKVAAGLGCLALVGCGPFAKIGADVADGPISGADWRVTASYVPLDFEHGDSVDVLAGMDTTQVVFFYDKVVKEVYTSVVFPYESTDSQITFDSLRTDDFDADGYTDFSVIVANQDGEQECLCYTWNPDTKEFDYYEVIAAEDLEDNDIDADNDSFESYVGQWVYSEEGVTVTINDDYSCTIEPDGVDGYVTLTYDGAEIYTADDNYYCTLNHGLEEDGDCLLDFAGNKYVKIDK